MAILNYTTTIKIEKTSMEIQSKLVKAGAQAVLCEYDPEGVLCALSFRTVTASGLISFRMPAQMDGVYNAIKRDSKVPRRLKTREQAARVAWRILKDWVEAQIALIEAGMAELPEVFLAYAQDSTGITLYEKMKKSNYLLLGSGE